MNLIVLYLLLLKATVTSFSGLSSLPIIHADFVVKRHALTDRQLNTAVASGRSGPGPMGLYVVSIGYMVDGIPGALAGYAAMITPAFLIIPLLRFFALRASHPRVKGAIRGILLSAAGLLISSAIPLSQGSVTDPVMAAIAAASFGLLSFTRVETLWVVLASATLGLAVGLVRVY